MVSHVPLAQAYLPYMMLGQLAAEVLTQTGMRPEQAHRSIYENPSFVDEEL